MQSIQKESRSERVPMTIHMKQLGDRYNPKTKILKTQNGERLQKYFHGYFTINKLNKKALTLPVKKFLQSYPDWIIEQKEYLSEEFQTFFKVMIEAHPKLLSIFQDQIQMKESLFKGIDHIRFPYLKELKIHFQLGTNLEPLSWIQAPLLQSIKISSKSVFTSLSSLAKTNFQILRIIKLQIQDRMVSQQRNYDLGKVSRIRLLNKRKKQKEIADIQRGQINFFRADISDISPLAKLEIERLSNFEIPQIGSKYLRNSLKMNRMIQTLNRKYQNKTYYSDLVYNTSWFIGDDIYANVYDYDYDND